MSKHFKYLKSTIQSQLRNTSSKVAAGKDGLGKEDMATFGLMGGGAALLRGTIKRECVQPASQHLATTEGAPGACRVGSSRLAVRALLAPVSILASSEI
jgi:hypothetical protein